MTLPEAAQAAVSVAAVVLPSILLMLFKRGLSVAEQRLHLSISAQTEATIDKAAQTAAGVLTTKMVSGIVVPSDLHLGNAHVQDAIATALNVAGDAAYSAGVTRETVGARIIGLVGRVLGEDATVPTVPAIAPTLSVPSVTRQ